MLCLLSISPTPFRQSYSPGCLSPPAAAGTAPSQVHNFCICLFRTSWHFCQPVVLRPLWTVALPSNYGHYLNFVSFPKTTKVCSVSVSPVKALSSINPQEYHLYLAATQTSYQPFEPNGPVNFTTTCSLSVQVKSFPFGYKDTMKDYAESLSKTTIPCSPLAQGASNLKQKSYLVSRKVICSW